MHARVSRFHGQGVSGPSVQELLPTLREMEGFRGVISLRDADSGDSMAITLWASQEAMRASEAQADEMRRKVADDAGDEIRGVERYEVEALELEE